MATLYNRNNNHVCFFPRISQRKMGIPPINIIWIVGNLRIERDSRSFIFEPHREEDGGGASKICRVNQDRKPSAAMCRRTSLPCCAQFFHSFIAKDENNHQ